MSGLGADDAPGAADTFRPELEGLRAVAVGLVLLFHAQIPGWTGGFVGVDVFFVLSGFLITGLIVRELRQTGRIDLPRFYARRARRLLPAAAVALLGTVVLSALFLPPLRLPDVGADAAAAALYVSNLRFAFNATDYLASGLPPSPLLHFWSLGVEEQFYLLWPALLLGVALLASRGAAGRVLHSSAILAIAIGGVGLASLVTSIVLTSISQPWAFFSLPTRAWELALGGLLALAAERTRLLSPRLAGALVVAGLAAIAGSAMLLGHATPFPGVAALVPTIGTALVIAGGAAAAATLPGRLLQLGPVRYLGRISYSLYLWHWPILTIPAAIAVDGLDLPARLALVAVAVLVAAASQRWIEAPVIRGNVGMRVRRTLAVAGATSLIVALVAVCVGGAIGASLPGGTGSVEPPMPSLRPVSYASLTPAASPVVSASGVGASPTAPGTPVPGPSPVGSVVDASPVITATAAPTPRPSRTPTPTPKPSVQPLRPPLVAGPVPENLTPSLQQARDRPIVYDVGCHLEALANAIPECAFGDVGSSTTVVLYGDSHAAHWFPALERIADAQHWRLVSLTKSGCTPVLVGLWHGSLDRRYTECDTWRQDAILRIEQEQAALVVVTSAHIYEFLAGDDLVTIGQRPGLWDAGLEEMLAALASPGRRVAFLGDTPRSRFDVPDCISAHLDDASACATPVNVAINFAQIARERTIVRAAGATFIDPGLWVCPNDPCPAVVGRYLVLRDNNHLTVPFAASMAQDLLDALPQVAG